MKASRGRHGVVRFRPYPPVERQRSAAPDRVPQAQVHRFAQENPGQPPAENGSMARVVFRENVALPMNPRHRQPLGLEQESFGYELSQRHLTIDSDRLEEQQNRKRVHHRESPRSPPRNAPPVADSYRPQHRIQVGRRGNERFRWPKRVEQQQARQLHAPPRLQEQAPLSNLLPQAAERDISAPHPRLHYPVSYLERGVWRPRHQPPAENGPRVVLGRENAAMPLETMEHRRPPSLEQESSVSQRDLASDSDRLEELQYRERVHHRHPAGENRDSPPRNAPPVVGSHGPRQRLESSRWENPRRRQVERQQGNGGSRQPSGLHREIYRQERRLQPPQGSQREISTESPSDRGGDQLEVVARLHRSRARQPETFLQPTHDEIFLMDFLTKAWFDLSGLNLPEPPPEVTAERIQRARRAFDECVSRFVSRKAAGLVEPGGRPDQAAYALLKEDYKVPCSVGALPGIQPGMEFHYQSLLVLMGIHPDISNGVGLLPLNQNRKAPRICPSLLHNPSSKYQDVLDTGPGRAGEVVYEGHKPGLQDSSNTARNRAIVNSFLWGFSSLLIKRHPGTGACFVYGVEEAEGPPAEIRLLGGDGDRRFIYKGLFRVTSFFYNRALEDSPDPNQSSISFVLRGP